MNKLGAIRWLRQIPGEFWERVKQKFMDIDEARRSEMILVNKELQLREGKRFQKHLSYVGPIKAASNLSLESPTFRLIQD